MSKGSSDKLVKRKTNGVPETVKIEPGTLLSADDTSRQRVNESHMALEKGDNG